MNGKTLESWINDELTLNDRMEKITSIEELRPEEVEKLSEEEVHDLMYTLIIDLPKEKRSHYVDMLRVAFDLRSTSPTKSYLKRDMIFYGYKFFPIPNNDKLILGVKRKIVKAN